MRRLFFYVSRQYAALVGLCLLGLVTLVVGTTLVENAGGFLRDADGTLVALRLSAWSAVESAWINWPIAAFLACLVCGNQLAQHGELLAMQASGAGPTRTYLPFIVVTLCGAGLFFVCGEYALPYSVQAKQRTLERFRARDAATNFFARRTPWFLDGDQLLYLPDVDPDTETFYDPTVYHLHHGRITQVTTAQRLTHQAQAAAGWVLDKAERHDIDRPDIERADHLAVALHVSPRDLIDVTGNPRLLRFPALRSLIERRQHAGFDTTAHRLELHSRLAQPLSALLLVLLALPYATSPNRRRTLSGTLGAGVVVIALYLSTSQVIRLMAAGHDIAVVWGAWGAPALCLGMIILRAIGGGRMWHSRPVG